MIFAVSDLTKFNGQEDQANILGLNRHQNSVVYLTQNGMRLVYPNPKLGGLEKFLLPLLPDLCP